MYTIAGKQFELRPITLRQRQMVAPIEQKILGAIRRLATIQEKKGNKNLDEVFSVGVDIDAIILGSDFPQFLATILTPCDAERWEPSMAVDHAEMMLEIDEATQAEVLRDFLSRRIGSTDGSPIFTSVSVAGMKKSGNSESSEDSKTPKT